MFIDLKKNDVSCEFSHCTFCGILKHNEGAVSLKQQYLCNTNITVCAAALYFTHATPNGHKPTYKML